MNVAIVMIRIGAAVATTLPSPVSPITRAASVETPAASAPATRKIRNATTTFGRNAQTVAMNELSASIPSAVAASEIAARKIAQKASVPTSFDGRDVTRE